MTPHEAPMSSDYLWDKSGEPGADVAALERLLGGMREHCPIPALGQLPAVAPRRSFRVAGRAALALAATIILVPCAAALRVWLTPWTVTALEGSVRVGETVAASPMSVRGGQVIETSETSRALLEVGVIGHVEIDTRSRVRIVTTNRREHRLALEHGRISVVIAAPPRWFTVDTPSAAAIDLGCAYVLEVDAAGRGTLRVQEGWVELDGGAYEAIVPEHAMAHLRAGRGPGSPYYQDVSDVFREALSVVDFGRDDEIRSALPVLLADARPRDSLTLLSLLRRLSSAGRGEVYDRLSTLLPPPAQVTRERIVGGDNEAVDQWWEVLALPRPRKLYPRLWASWS